jgi:uncharacterized protein GlcG (DUF336 family)
MVKSVVLIVLLVCMATSVFAAPDCKNLPSDSQLRSAMQASASSTSCTTNCVGGLFQGQRMWGAIVNRDGEICAFTTTTADPTQVWPGSQAIAKAKAYTANAFSLDSLPLSTANLYTFTQPGHSLWSLGQSNLWNPKFTEPPDAEGKGGKGGNKDIAGGLIFFGGGVPLYKDGKIVGGLGISGDTSCADHEIAKRTRNNLSLNPPAGATADDIVYSPPDAASVFAHPQCPNTWRNGTKLQNEKPESYPPGPPTP